MLTLDDALDLHGYNHKRNRNKNMSYNEGGFLKWKSIIKY